MPRHAWALVLAGGSGRRLGTVTGGVPKQFWKPDGHRSLLEGTLSRLASSIPLSHTVIIVDELHRPFVAALHAPLSPATIVYQPADRGTAAGVLCALMPVLDDDPDALVVVTPSDHAVSDEATFRAGLDVAIDRVRDHDDVVLFGVEAASPDESYGWIVPSAHPGPGPFDRVAAFVEKPDRDTAHLLHVSRARWNTMIAVARARDLLRLFAPLPQLTDMFYAAGQLSPPIRVQFLAEAYRHLQATDFSRDVLERARGLLTLTWPASMGWSDLGTPERFERWRDAAPTAPRGLVAATSAA